MSAPRGVRCAKCGALLPEPAPHPDGLPGVLYRTCEGCGTSRAVTRRPRVEKLAKPAQPGP